MLRPLAAVAGCALLLAAGGCALPMSAPVDGKLLARDTRQRLDAVIAQAEPVAGPISLYEAMARALKYNLDHRIEQMDEVLRARQFDLRRFDLLPRLVANAGYGGRSNDAGASSRSLLTGQQSLEPSTSSARENLTADLELSWDVLDFGLSYVRAQQTADERLIAGERRRKVANRIIEDVRTAYWRAVSADRTLGRLVELEALTLRALRDAEAMEERRVVGPLVALSYQRDLLQTHADVQRLQRDLALAKSQLAAMMNLAPNANFKLVLPERSDAVPEMPGSADEMVTVALAFRPEVRESAYRRRINLREQEAALLQALPSLKGVLGINFDSNRYLYRDQWVDWGARTSWNLLSAFRYPQHKGMVEAEAAVLEQRDLALTMAVTTQVHVSRLRFVRLTQELVTGARSHAVHDRLLAQVRAGYKANSVAQQQLVREELNEVLSQVRYDVAYADAQNAYAGLFAAMGLDNFDADVHTGQSVASLAKALERHWNDRATTLPTL